MVKTVQRAPWTLQVVFGVVDSAAVNGWKPQISGTLPDGTFPALLRMVKKLPSVWKYSSPPTPHCAGGASRPSRRACHLPPRSGRSRFHGCGNTRSRTAADGYQKVSPRQSWTRTEHSTMPPGRPSPPGRGQLGFAGLTPFQSTKSSGPAWPHHSTRAPICSRSSIFLGRTAYAIARQTAPPGNTTSLHYPAHRHNPMSIRRSGSSLHTGT